MQLSRLSLLLILSLGWLTGCASSVQRADRFFDERYYTDAAAAYQKVVQEAETKGPSAALERSLFRLAMLHFLPQSPVHDPNQGRALLEQLIDRFNAGAYRAQAAVILELDQRERRLRNEAAAQRLHVEEIEEASSSLGEDAAGLRSTLSQLRQDIQRLNSEITECHEQLEKLKAIDLGSSSGGKPLLERL